MISNVLTRLKTKALVLVVATALVIGGATAVFAAAPSGQNVPHTFTQSNPTGTITPGHKSDSDQNDDRDAEGTGKHCDNSSGKSHPATTARPDDDKDAERTGKHCDDSSGKSHPTTTARSDDD